MPHEKTMTHSRFPEMHDDTPPPSRRRSWGQPEMEEPIIDAARISLTAFGNGRSPRRR
jgi:hypothetical protein